MSHLVIARKYRPASFSSVIGQDHVVVALARALLSGRVPHALLFAGSRGVGKTSMARLLARALNCNANPARTDSSPSDDSPLIEDDRELIRRAEPCGKCSNCVDIVRGTSVSVLEIDGASHNSVEDVRDLTSSLRIPPARSSNYKVYIVDEVHMLSIQAFNALLKSLEEPPPRTIFVFATTDPQKLPDTVLSRCQRYDFKGLSDSAIAAQLERIASGEGIAAEPEVFSLIARMSHGAMRDAQFLLESLRGFATGGPVSIGDVRGLFGLARTGFFLELIEAIFARNGASCIALVDELFSASPNMRLFVDDMISYFRAMLFLKLDPNSSKMRELSSLDPSELSALELKVRDRTLSDLQRFFDLVQSSADALLKGYYPRYVLEALFVKMASMASLRPLGEILALLERELGASKETLPKKKI